MSIPVRNISTSPQVIKGFDRSCDCVAVEPRSLTLAPGASATIQLVIDLTQSRDRGQGKVARPYSAEIRPILDGAGAAGPVWRITGVVRNGFELSRTFIYLGEVTSSDIPRTSHQIIARGQVPLKRLTARCDPKLATVEVTPPPTGEGETYLIDITLHEPEKPGRFRVPIDIDGETEGGRLCRARAVVEGVADDNDIAHEPASLVLGVVTNGRPVSGDVVLRSRSNRDFVVRGIECDSDELTVIHGIALGEGSHFPATYKGETTGPVERRIRFRIEMDDGTEIQEVVALTCHGTNLPTGPPSPSTGRN